MELIKAMNEHKSVSIAIMGMCGIGIGIAAMRFVEKLNHDDGVTPFWSFEPYGEREEEEEDDIENDIEDWGDDEVDEAPSEEEEKPYLNSSAVPEKPSMSDILEPGTPDTPKPTIISMEDYQALEDDHMHVATYFVEDEILAGVDDDLDELDPQDVFGGVPEEALTELKNGSTSGLYVMCGNGMDAIEIVSSHDNYLEAYNEAVNTRVDEIMADTGYSKTRPVGRPS